MANGRQAAKKRLNRSERAQQQLELHFPEIDDRCMWHRKTNDGFTTVPRTMPLVMQAVDDVSKGTPPGHTLFCLWARSPDHPLLTIENPATFAAEAGFKGERAVDTWRKRMKRLRDLGMIQTKRGASGDFHYVLLLNPNAGVEAMRARQEVANELYGRFIDRMADVGAMGEIEAIQEYWKEQAAAKAAPAPSADAPVKSRRRRAKMS